MTEILQNKLETDQPDQSEVSTQEILVKDVNLPETVTNRQELIDTAVRFLRNPKVIPTPIENKKLFLTKKGLTDSEIVLALKQANCAITEAVGAPISQQDIFLAPIEQSPLHNPRPKPRTFLQIIFGWVKKFFLAGAVAFTAYKLITSKYFKWPGDDKKLEVDERRKAEQRLLQESIKEMRGSLHSLKQTIEVMNSAVTRISIDKVNSDTTGLKNEVQSIKNLLLSRTQFPGVPAISPVLPAWQLESKSTDNISKEPTSVTSNRSTEDLLIIERNNNHIKSIDELGNVSKSNFNTSSSTATSSSGTDLDEEIDNDEKAIDVNQ